MKKTLSANEKIALDRISELIRRKLIHLGRTREPLQSVDLPVTLLEFVQYQKGLRQVPLCHLALLLKFYGCSQQTMAEWNLKVSILTFRALKKARGKEISLPPRMEI